MSIPCASCSLPNGSELVLSVPEPDLDVDSLIRFFRRVPPGEKVLVPYDVEDAGVVRSKLLGVDHQPHWRLIAVVDGEVVGAGLLDRERAPWMRHMATLRVLLDHKVGEIGIRRVLCDRLVSFARDAGVERLCTEVLQGDGELVTFYEHQGFEREFVRRGVAKDPNGNLHDVVMLSNDLEHVWRQLEDNIHDLDVSITRLSGIA